MQTQVLVQPPPLLALAQRTHPTRPRVLNHLRLSDLPFPIDVLRSTMDKERKPAASSGPNYSYSSSTTHLDEAPHSGHHDISESALSLTSPQQSSTSVPNPSEPASYGTTSLPRHSGTLSPSEPSSRPSTGTEPSTRNLSASPSSTVQIRPTLSFPHPYSAPHNQDHFASSETSYPPNMDRYSIANLADRYLRGNDKYSHNQHPLLDQRRMSAPALYGSSASGYPTNPAADLSSARYQQLHHEYSYVSPRSYRTDSPSLPRPLNIRPINDPLSGSSWREEQQPPLPSFDFVELEEPLSPFNPTFSGGESSPNMGISGMMYGSLHEEYGPSPPGTGTSTTSSIAPTTRQSAHLSGGPGSPSNSKQYSFVSLPGNAVKKRPRRRYDEIERLYRCSWPDCTKAYGTLNHLNAHVTMQKHGSKRSPNEFKELRKQWRKTKKEEAESRTLDAMRHGSHQHPPQHHFSRGSMSEAEYQPHYTRSHLDLSHPHERYIPSLDEYTRRSQRPSGFVPPHIQNSGVAYSSPHPPGVNTSTISMNRLPVNSTLLTPLPGYEPPSMSGVPDIDPYSSYDLYNSDSRPGTGHGSVGSYDDRRRSSIYGEEGRPRSSHYDLGSGQNPDRS